MAITQSAKKAHRQSLRRKESNLDKKNKMKKLLREFKTLVVQKKNEEAKKLLPQIQKALDKATKTGIIKANAASRKKSRLVKSLSPASR
jgi:small subunit ribosomal protein S20